MREKWESWYWLVEIAALVFFAGIAWDGVASQGVRIDKLEATIKDMPASLARIEQKVDDLKDIRR